MSDPAYIVQFPHPGAEHRPRGSVMPWNVGPHARKFMLADATYTDERSTEYRGKVVFWGEWEAPSRVVRRWTKQGDLPRYLHEPYLDTPPASGFRQNTDPWVFGDSFYYSCCKQRTNKGRSATAMQRLTAGSLILYGSSLGNDFVLDTAFVVGRRLGSFVAGGPLAFQVDETFRVATIDSIASDLNRANEGASFTLYEGATQARPLDTMFSFVPCLPYDGEGPRFSRPAIQLPGIVNPLSRQSAAGATHPRELAEVKGVWASVAQQVIDQDLMLATNLQLSSVWT